jgi:hypothetical protein
VRTLKAVTLGAVVAAIFGGGAVAQEALEQGHTSRSGPGQHITPSTVIQKQEQDQTGGRPSGSPASGLPGVEGKPGSESGKAYGGATKPGS